MPERLHQSLKASASAPAVSNSGAIAPKTLANYFSLCGAIAFFFLSPIKRAASDSLKIMLSYTGKEDELYLEVQNVKLPDYIPTLTMCYKTLYQYKEIIERARVMENSAKYIRHEFYVFANSGFPLPTSTLLKKAVVLWVKQGKLISTGQALRMV